MTVQMPGLFSVFNQSVYVWVNDMFMWADWCDG